MRRLTREDVTMLIATGLTLQKQATKRALGIEAEQVREQLAKDLTHRIMGAPESEAVVLMPSYVRNAGDHGRAGRWGTDEPHPETYLPQPPPLPTPPAPSCGGAD